jgi:4-hydroxybenzoate polyprenyltransferase
VSPAAALARRVGDFAGLVRFSHTLFLFPFALGAVLLANRVNPVTPWVVWWIVVALVAARSAAMIMNRIADRRFDAQNPRTATRHLVTGQVSPALAAGWLAASCAIFVLAAWMLSDLCLILSPVALVWVLGYSFTKRFTALCHIWLGAATALAPLGAWVAVTGSFDWRALVLAATVTLWVAGFDVIYACQDVDFDRDRKLHSLPAKLGVRGGLRLSLGLHLAAAAGLLLMGPIFDLGRIYLSGAVLMALILMAEQALVHKRLARVPLAFFTFNGMVSLLFLAAVALDLWVGGGGV